MLSSKKKMGRPTNSLKRHDIRVRVNDETFEILQNYCEKEGKNKAEAIRDGIHRLKDPK